MKKKKIIRYWIAGSLALYLFACSNSAPFDSFRDNYKEDFTELEKEYQSLKIQAITAPYLIRKLDRWLATGNSAKLLKELKFASYKNPTALQVAITEKLDPVAYYNSLKVDPVVSAYMVANPSFNTFMASLAPAPAPTATPNLGANEFRVNTYTVGHQLYPDMAMDSNSRFVITWFSLDQDGSRGGIYGQVYNPAASVVGTEFRVNTYTTGMQADAKVSMDNSGNFVVAWNSWFQDGSTNGVYGQRFDSSGVRLGTEFRVNTQTFDNQEFPAVSMDNNGNFIVVWQSYTQDGSLYGIYGQRFNAAGVPQGTEFRVNTYTTDQQRFPAVVTDSLGNFVVTWQSFGQDGSAEGIYAKRYNSLGVAQGAEFKVNSYTTGEQSSPAIGMNSTGDFVIAWNSNLQDGSSYGIYAQRYNALGVAQGTEFRVNTTTANEQSVPNVTVMNNGSFSICWNSNLQDGSGFGVYAQDFQANGTPRNPEKLVNTTTTNDQALPRISGNKNSKYGVVWYSLGHQDGMDGGIFGKLF